MEQTDRDREIAIQWWDKISQSNRDSLQAMFSGNVNISDKEIEEIWREWSGRIPIPSPTTLEGEQFTPGLIKWVYDTETDSKTIFVISEQHGAICKIPAEKATAEHEANANRIVKAWNCHDDLVNALKPFKLLAQEVLDVKDQPQIIYEFNGAKITTEDLSNVLKAMYKASPNTLNK